LKRPLLYLDQNALVDVIMNRDPSFATVVRKFCASTAQAVYAPPHIEEIANIYRSKASHAQCGRYIAEHLKGICDLTDCWELLPNDEPDAPGRLIQEAPQDCLSRVIDKFELTYLAEDTEEALREYVPAARAVNTPVNAFEYANVRAIWQIRMLCRGFDPECCPTGSGLRSSFQTSVAMVDICFRSLRDSGFGLEAKRKTRSSIHDVSHAIYAIMADLFVSNDARMLEKAKATFSFLKSECVVYSPSEFVAYIEDLLDKKTQQVDASDKDKPSV